MVLDNSSTITIYALGAPWAHIEALRQLDAATSIWHNLFPEGETGYCTIGAQCYLNLRLKNAGTAAGTIYITVTRTDTNAVIFDQQYSLAADGYVDISNPSPNFVMPGSDIGLRLEIGHI